MCVYIYIYKWYRSAEINASYIFASKSSRARGVCIIYSAYKRNKTLLFSDDGSTISFRNAVFKLNGMREKCNFTRKDRVKMDALVP